MDAVEVGVGQRAVTQIGVSKVLPGKVPLCHIVAAINPIPAKLPLW